MANVIAAVDRPALVIAHNKTLAAQLYGEFKALFPENAVAYFVSYYDYYQPEAYIPSTDTYIEKDSAINEEIDKLRHAATHFLLERRDVIIVASVSCIYGLGSRRPTRGCCSCWKWGMEVQRDAMLARLVEIQYERNDIDFHRGTFRVRGDVVEIFPLRRGEGDPRGVLRRHGGGDLHRRSAPGEKLETLRRTAVYPGRHFVTTQENLKRAIIAIREELGERLRELNAENKLLEAQRLEQRTHFDIEMMEEMGYCSGIENYSRHLTGRKPGPAAPDADGILSEGRPHLHRREPRDDPPAHRDVPGRPGEEGDPRQLRFPPPVRPRQPAAPLRRVRRLPEPADLRLGDAGGLRAGKGRGRVVEQIIRPTGLMDPEIIVKPVIGQVDDLLGEIRKRAREGRAGPGDDADENGWRRT